jgi:hypothetical protein
MALVASGAIALSDVNVELGFSSTATIALNDAAVRTLFGIASGAISMSDGYGKANTLGYVEEVFSTYNYTGDGSTQTITNGINLSSSGGLVWIKSRTNTFQHNLIDTVRGPTNRLSSNTTDASSNDGGSPSFNSNGFTVVANSSGYTNSSQNFVSWTFRKAQKFFDIVTYTGSNSAQTFAHNLGSAPGCIFIKKLDSVNGDRDWSVYHRSLTNPNQFYLALNTTDSAVDFGLNYISGVNSTTFTVGGGYTNINRTGSTYVAYLFAHNAGGYGATGTDNIITCGSYTGSDVATTTVTLGYEPQWILIKRATNAGDAFRGWVIFDNMRGMPVGGTSAALLPHTSDAENPSTANNDFVLPTATGFTLNQAGSNLTNTSNTYIFIAIRRGLMKPVNTSVFNPKTRSSSGPVQLISGIGFAPDLAIIKARTVAIEPHWFNRLIGNNRALVSNSQDAEFTNSFTILGATGTVTAGSNSTALNGHNYVDWFFRRATGFFDIVTYTGNGSASRNITHGLGATPELIILRSRNGSGVDWYVNATPFTNWTNGYPCAFLNTTNTITGNSNTGVKNPTSTTFEVSHPNTNTSNSSFNLYIAFIFATYPGISKVGSYSGTGALQTVNCGFTSGARFILIKRIDSTGGWYVWDSARGITSGSDPYLLLNSVNEEVGGTNYVDTHSTGFQVTAAAPADLNASGGSYFFFAIA